MAYLQKRPSGWRICYRINGKLQYIAEHRRKPITQKGVAQEVLERAQELEDAGRRLKPGEVIPLREIVDRWHAAKTTGPSPNDAQTTKMAVGQILYHCRAMGWEMPGDITASSIVDWRKRPALRTRMAGALLRAVLRWARDHQGQPVSDQVLAALRPPRQARRIKAPLLSRQQVDAALEAARGYSASGEALVHCLATYGWRPITAARMVVGNLVGSQITCRVKGGHDVRHPLLPQTLAMLAPLVEGRAKGDPLFQRPLDGLAWRPYFKWSIPWWCWNMLGVKSYDLKRYAISHLVSILPVQEVQAFTGHLTISQLLTYARTNEAQQLKSLQVLNDYQKRKEAEIGNVAPSHSGNG